MKKSSRNTNRSIITPLSTRFDHRFGWTVGRSIIPPPHTHHSESQLSKRDRYSQVSLSFLLHLILYWPPVSLYRSHRILPAQLSHSHPCTSFSCSSLISNLHFPRLAVRLAPLHSPFARNSPPFIHLENLPNQKVMILATTPTSSNPFVRFGDHPHIVVIVIIIIHTH